MTTKFESCLKALEEERAKTEEKLEFLRKQISGLYSLQYKLTKDIPFCLKGGPENKCPECEFMLPEIWLSQGNSGIVNYRWPYKTPKWFIKGRLVKGIQPGVKGCFEWKKKEPTTACGCAGDFWCECGYKIGSCYGPNNGIEQICPYCEKICNWTPTTQRLHFQETRIGIGGSTE